MQSEYSKIGSEHLPEETKLQMEAMQQDLARIKDKEEALDAENKILRDQLFKSSKSRKTPSVSKMSAYQALPGEMKQMTPSKSKVDTGYAKLPGVGSPGQ